MTTAYSEQGYCPLDIESDSNVVIESGSTPVRNMVATAKDNTETETFSGWLKVEVPSERTCRITALVDDNGSFSINGATTEIASGTHGSRRYTPEVQVTLKPGYYFVQCRLEDLPPLNQAYSNVKHFQAFIKWNDDNGNEVTQAVTQLFDIKPLNLMRKIDAEALMNHYHNYQYIAHTRPDGVIVGGLDNADVYAAVGGTIGSMFGKDGYEDSCALRVTQAMCDYGVTLPDEPDLHTSTLNDPLDWENSNQQTVYIRAESVANYLEGRERPNNVSDGIDYPEGKLGEPTFTCASDFFDMVDELAQNSNYANSKPIVIWWLRGHVGMGYEGEGDSQTPKSTYKFVNATKIWVLYRPDYADPASCPLKDN